MPLLTTTFAGHPTDRVEIVCNWDLPRDASVNLFALEVSWSPLADFRRAPAMNSAFRFDLVNLLSKTDSTSPPHSITRSRILDAHSEGQRLVFSFVSCPADKEQLQTLADRLEIDLEDAPSVFQSHMCVFRTKALLDVARAEGRSPLAWNRPALGP